MQNTDIDPIVQSSAAETTDQDIDKAAREIERQIQGRAWNMNQPLNMIAYEDQS
ncbi:hypothetical protein [Cupriavidus alkaliphilus]|uniref:Uncharacterized protein n=1 Tax=Cupriavidus alkaliphilus TaxID=942866 RepID=A0A7W4VBU5_9BURK|nr:hypothetical protein [Cupriavidus alkaliphilus]MBB3008364.1 hypothetical protein [Cupriavidus alkaliphilus]PVY78464.1 hypothetical protein C7414_10613 [Cupriavidus alkaliphilus]SCB25693.1 hypothetical protein GA0116996_107344 [Cupriavidus alkaliphilus]